ncbi:TOX high mobility group box family member 4-A-like isoform X2 [Carassius auratus]|uniref:TOX high mobility group box family member 4-A-like isoform X2 n=1 Tax=Carassius auratus TaxID=7957 RepID=A0A6P6JM12_CARAU|nr:TOX high mobility group box family member 4-A-like isoform X2 [Carassius auratus]XP_052403302.1 TOX high mobility group box family member 4-A-like isoform X1 [Carassius gibelio]XP_052403303.1 TOX high mobility group box family member 4-A-like isoform X1 [Carassius gibelio]XP_052403304.1 TOX high mobility group box family member 4-A-like isoform X1 [Carassius gibelio]XP_052403305.1 TOX high mobility group box family member 4-A-like isoform X1 [Carassius gibelio]
MDLNFYSDLSDGTGQHVESEFMDNSSYNGYDPVNKFAGGNDSYLTISGPGHHWSSEVVLHKLQKTFHTPCLGDEEFEIPPISLDPDSALTIEDVEAHFGELAEQAETSSASGVGNSLARNPVVVGNDPSFASAFMNPSSQGIEHLSMGVINQPGGSTLLSSTLGVDLGHSVGSHFNSSSSMTIDVPINDMNHSLLGHSQLTTIDHSDLSAQLGLSLSGTAGVSKSPDQLLSTTPSPAGSLQDEDMEDFRQKTMLVDPSSASLMPNLTGSAQLSSAPPSVVRRVGGKPAMVPLTPADTGTTLGGKKGKKKKDPNEPQKPVSAYALFFRDTQAAIKGQNPNATFGEVSKIVASMWDSLGEEQKQVYKRKTEAAKKEYLKALATYRANQLSKSSTEVEDSAPSTPPSVPCPAPVTPTPAAPARPRLTPIPEQNTITNICASNIILDGPQVTTRSRTGSLPLAISQPPTPTVTKIIISKQMLQGGSQIHQIPTSMVTVIPAALRAVQPAAAGRQPPPLQQMQGTPPPPRLQQMVQTQAPPPLQAKPRGGAGGSVAVTATPPPPLQIKIVPASLHSDLSTPIIVTTATSANPVIASTTISASVHPTPVEVQVEDPKEELVTGTDEAVTEEPEEMEMEVSVAPEASSSAPSTNLCVRAGCTNPAVESRDWDKEYCSNECVATHCRDIFMAWCSIKSQNSATVK